MTGDRLSPGQLARTSDRQRRLPLFDRPEMTGKMSAYPTSWAPEGALLLVLAVIHEAGGHERVLVLYGQGQTGWCWGGHLEPEPP